MSEVLITIEEVLNVRAVPQRAQMWQARHATTGEIIGEPARNPFFNAARILAAGGADPSSTLVLVHQGDVDQSRFRLRGKLGEMAKLTVVDDDKGRRPPYLAKWRPLPDIRKAPLCATGNVKEAQVEFLEPDLADA
jgi:hypothetical protein